MYKSKPNFRKKSKATEKMSSHKKQHAQAIITTIIIIVTTGARHNNKLVRSSLLYLHNVLNVASQNGVLYYVEDNLNVLGVGCRGEVPVELLGTVLPHRIEHANEVVLNVAKVTGVATEILEVILDVPHLNLIGQEVGLVEEEDDGDASEAAVVDDGVKDVDALLEPVSRAVFQESLVVLAGAHEEEDGRDLVKALEPLLSLRPLTSDVDKAEGNTFDVYHVLVDTARGFTGVEDVHSRGEVAQISDDVQRAHEVGH